MNDSIIKKLSTKALDIVSNKRVVKEQEERTWNPDEYDHVFANLIIEECAKICDDHATMHGFEGCYANECAMAVRALKDSSNKPIDLADIIAGELKVSRGTAYDLMQEAIQQMSNNAKELGLTYETNAPAEGQP